MTAWQGIQQWCREHLLNQEASHDSDIPSDIQAPPSFHQLLPYEAYDHDSALWVNHASLGFVLELSPKLGASEEDIDMLASFFNHRLPDNIDAQVLVWASPKVAPLLNAFTALRGERGELYQRLAKQREALLTRGAHTSLSAQSSLLVRHYRFFLVVSQSHHQEDDKAQLTALREELVSTLQSMQVAAHPLGLPDFMSVMRDILYPSHATTPAKNDYSPYDPINEQLGDESASWWVMPDHLRLEREAAAKDDWDIRCLTVKQFPKHYSQGQMGELLGPLFSPQLQWPCPFLISMTVRALPHDYAQGKATFKNVDKEKKANSPLAKLLPGLGKEMVDWRYLQTRLGEGDRLLKGQVQVVLFSPPGEGLKHQRTVMNLFKHCHWALVPQRYLQLQAWLSVMPMLFSEGMYHDLSRFGRLKTLTGFNVANLLPLQGEWRGLWPPKMLFLGRRGQLVPWDNFAHQEGNYNLAIAASSGSGKSVWTQEYIVATLGHGGQVTVFDAGRSYEKTCQLLGGSFIAFEPDNPRCLNPFTSVRDMTTSLPQLKPLLATMARPNDKVSREEENRLEKALTAVFAQQQNAMTMTDVVAWLNEQDTAVDNTLSLLLYPYTKNGMYGAYFEGENTLDLSNAFVVLELQELKKQKELQKIVLMTMMHQVTQTMYLSDRTRQKSCIIDEAWDLLAGESDVTARFIAEGYRTARRFNGNFITITQSLNDFFLNTTSQVAYENSDIKVLLRQLDDTWDQLEQQKRLSLTGFSKRLYRSLRKTKDYSEFVLKTPEGEAVLRLVLDPFSRILYSSKGKEFDAVKTWQAKGCNLITAIERVAEEEN